MNDDMHEFVKDLADGEKTRTGIAAFFDSIECGLWELNLTTEELWYTPFCEKIIGFSGDDFPRTFQSLRARIHPEDVRETMDNIQMTLDGKTSSGNHRFRLQHKDGQYIWVHERFSVTQSGLDGKAMCITGILHDISDIQNAEIRAEADRRHVEKVESYMGLGTWEWDVKRHYITYSENCTQMLARPQGSLDGPLEKIGEIMPPEHYDRINGNYQQWFVTTENTFTQEYPLYDRHNNAIWFYEAASVVERDAGGAPLLIRGVLLNIDETVKTRIRLEKSLQTIEAQNQLLRSDIQTVQKTSAAMFDANPQINLLVDETMRVIDCNPAAMTFFGFADKDALLVWLNQPSGELEELLMHILSKGKHADIAELVRKTIDSGYSEFVAVYPEKPMMNVAMKRIEYGSSFALVIYLSERSEYEEYTQLMLDAMPLSCILLDESCRPVDCNKQAVEMKGAQSKEELLDYYGDFFPEFQPDGSPSLETMREKVAQVLQRGTLAFRWTYRLKTGEHLPSEVTLVRIKWRDTYRVVAFSNDLRQIEQERERASDAEAYAQLMYDSTPLICSIWDESNRMIDCNQEAVRRFELKSKDEYINNFFGLSPKYQQGGKTSQEMSEYYIAKAVETGSQKFCWDYVTATGKPLPVETTLICIPWKGGYRILAYSRDMRDILAEKEKTEEIEAYTQMMLDATPIFCSVWNEDGEMIDCSMEALRLLGVKTKAECIENFFQLHVAFQPDGLPARDKVNLMVRRALETGYQRFEWEFCSSSGEIIPAEVTLIRVPFRNEYRVLSYATDLREVKKSAAKIEWHTNFLRTVNKVAKNLVTSTSEQFDQIMMEQIQLLGEVTGSNRCCIWENFELNGERYARQIYSRSSQIYTGASEITQIKYAEHPYIEHKMFASDIINCPVRELPEKEQALLSSEGVTAVLQLPLLVHDGIWGFIRFDNQINEQILSDSDVDILKTCGALLASSITKNRMTSNLITATNDLTIRGKLLEATNAVAEALLANDSDNFTLTAQTSLKILGQCVGADRVSIWRNFDAEDGRLCSRRLYGWIDGQTFEEASREAIIDYQSYLPEWDREATRRRDINLPLHSMNDTLRNFAILQYSQSLLLIHIEIDGRFWGFIGFSHSEEDHLFSETEIGILRSGGMTIASAYIQNETNERLVAATQAALASVKAKNEFLARMSHEIRTPLNAVVGMTIIAQNSDEKEKRDECLEVVSSSARQLLGIINDVLDMSNMDSGSMLLESKDYDFGAALTSVVKAIRPQIDRKSQHLTVDYNPPFARMMQGDGKRVAQLMSNLLSNAVKFTAEHGSITIGAHEMPLDTDRSELLIEVSDNGIGIAPECLPRLFEPFEQFDGSLTRQYGGSGLGLTICKHIVSAMGGEISVESEPGKGSRFTVRLPVTWGGPCGLTAPTSLDQSMRVLVIAAQQSELNYFSDITDRFSLSCDTSVPKDAMRMIREAAGRGTPYDVVFLEWELPEIGGEEGIRKIRKMSGNHPEIVVISTSDRALIAKEMTKAGVTHCLTKPALSSDIYNKLMELTNRNCVDTITPNERTDQQADLSDKTVLLVEDVELNRLIVEELLSETGIHMDAALARIDAARDRGLDVGFDIFSPSFGVSVITVVLPSWYLKTPKAKRNSPLNRARLAVEIGVTKRILGFDFSDMQVAWVGPEGKALAGKRVSEIAREWQVDDLTAYLRLVDMCDGNGRINLYRYYDDGGMVASLLGREDCLCMTDAWMEDDGLQNAAAFMAFPKFLAMSRAIPSLPLHKVVHKMTGATAARYGLKDRGLLQAGYAADITVFGPEIIAPDGEEPRRPLGIRDVYVNGRVIVQDGQADTAAMLGAGHVLRRG